MAAEVAGALACSSSRKNSARISGDILETTGVEVLAGTLGPLWVTAGVGPPARGLVHSITGELLRVGGMRKLFTSPPELALVATLLLASVEGEPAGKAGNVGNRRVAPLPTGKGWRYCPFPRASMTRVAACRPSSPPEED